MISYEMGTTTSTSQTITKTTNGQASISDAITLVFNEDGAMASNKLTASSSYSQTFQSAISESVSTTTTETFVKTFGGFKYGSINFCWLILATQCS